VDKLIPLDIKYTQTGCTVWVNSNFEETLAGRMSEMGMVQSGTIMR